MPEVLTHGREAHDVIREDIECKRDQCNSLQISKIKYGKFAI